MIESVKNTTIFVTIGEMYVSHVNYSYLHEEIVKLDVDKIYSRTTDSFIDSCHHFEYIEDAQKVCRELLKMGLTPKINKRSIVVRDEEVSIKENENDTVS